MVLIKLKNRKIEIATKQVDACIDYKQPRLDEIKRSEDAYFGKTKPALKGRFNIPIPIVEGFVETLMSKIDDPLRIEFKKGREATLKAAKKVSAAYLKDSAPDRGDFNGADMDAKKLAIFSGVGEMKIIAESNPYKQELVAVDYTDALFEPYGGRDLDKHLFKGEMNIMKSKKQLKDGFKAGLYEVAQVNKLLSGVSENELKQVRDQNENKANRYSAMHLTPKNYNYVGSDVYNLTELVTNINGVDWYILFHYPSGTWIRQELAKNVFPGEYSPYVAWQTERNPLSFLCRAPIDGIRPVGEAMRVLLNQNFDNIQHRNWDQILINARKIINPAQLQYKPNGIIRVNLKEGETMQSAYEKMQTPDTTSITINLLEWLTNYVGRQLGVTPGAQGQAEEKTNGIYFGNMQEIADRYSMLNKFYTQAHIKIGVRYKANLAKFMPPRKFMVRFIGLEGVQDEELTRDEANEELDINVISTNAEAKASALSQQKRENALGAILKSSALMNETNPKFLLEEVLRAGEYPEERIKFAADKEGSYDEELLSEAAKAIEDIVNGEKPKPNRGANLSFVKKIRNYAIDNKEDLDDTTFAFLLQYAADHLKVAEQNEIERGLFMQRLNAGAPPSLPAGIPRVPMASLPSPAPANAPIV